MTKNKTEEKRAFCNNAITEKKYINREALRSARMERKAEKEKLIRQI